MTDPRVILHADMDAFYASAEQRDHPELRGKPVVVGGDTPRSVVSTCSYEALQYGIRSAMPGTEARRRCPHAVFVPPRMSVYARDSKQIKAIFDRFTDLVEPLSLDEAFLDVTGSFNLFGNGEAIARQIKEEVHRETKLTISVGVATCKFIAKIASDLKKPDGLVVVPADQVLPFLAPLHISRLWGAGQKTQARLERFGFKTIGDIQKCSLGRLQKTIGSAAGHHFYHLSRSIDDRPVVSGQDMKSVSHEHTFEKDLTDREACHNILIELCENVGRRLRKTAVLGRTVRIKVRFGDFKTVTRQATVPATGNDFVIRRTAIDLFDAFWDNGLGIRLLGVAVDHLTSTKAPLQGDLFDDQDDGGAMRLLAAIDGIRDRFGRKAIRHGGALLKGENTETPPKK